MRYISLNIKHKKNSKNLNNIRSYNLKSALEGDQDIAVIAMNSIAKNMGLLATDSEYKILRINGTDMGLFIFSENFKKNGLKENIILQIIQL